MPDQSHVLLIVSQEAEKLILIEALSDSREIEFLKKALQKGVPGETPTLMKALEAFRIVRDRDDELFADHVESLLCKPFLKPKIRENCLDWLKSRARIEDLGRREREATRVIGEFAYRLLLQTPDLQDFALQSPKAEVRVEVLKV